MKNKKYELPDANHGGYTCEKCGKNGTGLDWPSPDCCRMCSPVLRIETGNPDDNQPSPDDGDKTFHPGKLFAEIDHATVKIYQHRADGSGYGDLFAKLEGESQVGNTLAARRIVAVMNATRQIESPELLKAAPELLAALELAHAELGKHSCWRVSDLRMAIRCAIAKAKGSQ